MFILGSVALGQLHRFLSSRTVKRGVACDRTWQPLVLSPSTYTLQPTTYQEGAGQGTMSRNSDGTADYEHY